MRKHPGLETLSAALSHHLDQYDERMLCEVAASYHMCRLGPEQLPHMLLQALETCHLPDGRCAAMVFRACTACNMQLQSRIVSRAIHQVFKRGFASWDLQSLSMFAAALAKLGVARKDVFRRVAQAAVQRCRAETITSGRGLHSLLVLLWAFAKAQRTQGEYATELFQTAGAAILQDRLRSDGAGPVLAARPAGPLAATAPACSLRLLEPQPCGCW